MLDEDFQHPSEEQANESELQKEQVTAQQDLKTLDCVCPKAATKTYRQVLQGAEQFYVSILSTAWLQVRYFETHLHTFGWINGERNTCA